MKTLRYNGVNIFNPIENKRDEIIKYFIDFYGEEHRKRIEYAYDNTTFVFVPKFQDEESVISILIDYHLKNEIKALHQELLNKYVSLIGWENIFSFEPVSLHFIKKNLLEDKFVEGDDADVINAFARKLKLSPRVSLNSKKDYYSKNAKQKIIALIDAYIEDYNANYKQKIDDLYEKRAELLDAVNSNLPDVKKIQQQFENDVNEVIDEYFYKIVSKIEPPRVIENIEEYNNIFRELLKRRTFPLSTFTTDDQKEKYIKLLNLFGYDFGKDYHNYYMHRDTFENLIYDKTIIKQINNLRAKEKEELVVNNEYLKEAVFKIGKLNIKGTTIKDDILNSIYNYVYNNVNLSGFVFPYIDSNTNNLKYVCVCADYFTISTSTFAHEYNHAIRMNLIQETPHTYKVKCGLDTIHYAKTPEGELLINNARLACSLDEIVNEWDAEEVACKMEKDNFSIGLCENRASTYRRGFIPFCKFIKENRQKLLDASLCNNRRLLLEYLGVEDYGNICDLAKDVLKIEHTDKVIREARKKLKKKNIRLSEIAEYFDKKKILLFWSQESEEIYDFTNKVNEYSEKLKNAKLNKERENFDYQLVANIEDRER